MKSLTVTLQMKATEQYFSAVLSINGGSDDRVCVCNPQMFHLEFTVIDQ